MAAHAVTQLGGDPFIASVKQKSKMFGAMYLHKGLYGINAPKPDFMIQVYKEGTSEGYAEKVYGDPEHPVSFDKYTTGQVQAWDLTETYDRLWEMYESKIIEMRLTPNVVRDICSEFAFVFSSISARTLCEEKHEFKSKQIWVLHGETSTPFDEYMMIYNGRPEQPWYRFSMIGKYKCWEFAKEQEESPYSSYLRWGTGEKPISNNCDCGPDNLIKIGRFGKWQKDVLTHHAYRETWNVLKEATSVVL